MIAGIKEDAVGYLYNLDVQVQQSATVVPQAVTDLVKAAGGGAADAATDDDADVAAGADEVEAGADEETAQEAPEVELRAKGLDDGPKPGQLQYSAATVEGQGRPLSRAERRRQERQERKSGKR